ncbi:hypothetical protein FAI40_02015 [Acetobacteraceae bacterium]|nr:hypothetical protein FAI40_02015 [Acetobacteraceae bacterium]
MAAQSPENKFPSMAVLLVLGKYNQLAALEYWLAHHLALGLSVFIAFSQEEECKEFLTWQSLLELLSKREKITLLGVFETSLPAEETFLRTAEEQNFSFTLRLALDEFFVPNLLDKKEEINEAKPYPFIKIPYRHCGLLGHSPQKILKEGLHPRHFYTKMTDGEFVADTEGRSLFVLSNQPCADSLQKAGILHDAAASSLTFEARHFFNQGSQKIPSFAIPARCNEITAYFWQDVLRHFLITRKSLPDWLRFPRLALSWHFLALENKKVLAVNHKNKELCAISAHGEENYSRLILAKEMTESQSKEGWLCLLDPAPFPFLPLKKCHSRTIALSVQIEEIATDLTAKIKILPTEQTLTLDEEKHFTLLDFSKNLLPYELAMLERLLSKGKAEGDKKNLLDGFPAPPVTALWALMTRPEFFHAKTNCPVFSLLTALLDPLMLSAPSTQELCL